MLYNHFLNTSSYSHHKDTKNVRIGRCIIITIISFHLGRSWVRARVGGRGIIRCGPVSGEWVVLLSVVTGAGGWEAGQLYTRSLGCWAAVLSWQPQHQYTLQWPCLVTHGSNFSRSSTLVQTCPGSSSPPDTKVNYAQYLPTPVPR